LGSCPQPQLAEKIIHETVAACHERYKIPRSGWKRVTLVLLDYLAVLVFEPA